MITIVKNETNKGLLPSVEIIYNYYMNKYSEDKHPDIQGTVTFIDTFLENMNFFSINWDETMNPAKLPIESLRKVMSESMVLEVHLTTSAISIGNALLVNTMVIPKNKGNTEGLHKAKKLTLQDVQNSLYKDIPDNTYLGNLDITLISKKELDNFTRFLDYLESKAKYNKTIVCSIPFLSISKWLLKTNEIVSEKEYLKALTIMEQRLSSVAIRCPNTNFIFGFIVGNRNELPALNDIT